MNLNYISITFSVLLSFFIGSIFTLFLTTFFFLIQKLLYPSAINTDSFILFLSNSLVSLLLNNTKILCVFILFK